MSIFFHLLHNLLPLYALILLGYVAGRWCGVDRRTLANLCIYICVPAVMFGFIAQLDFKIEYIALPILVYAVQAAIAFGMLSLGRRVYPDSRANILAMCSSMGNTGYFGLPLVMVLFGTQWVAVYMFMLVGFVGFEATIGYYIAARGAFDVRESIKKLIKYPVLYAVVAGLIVNVTHTKLPDMTWTYWGHFKGAYVVVGMMIIGAALSNVNKLVISARFLSLSFLAKFVLWPVLVLVVIFLDHAALGMFSEPVYKLLIITAIVPPAANITAFATQMNINPEKAATTVLLGTVFALVYIPAALVIWDMIAASL